MLDRVFNKQTVGAVKEVVISYIFPKVTFTPYHEPSTPL